MSGRVQARTPATRYDRFVGKRAARAYVRFYAELNDHLPQEQRFRTVEREFYVAGTAKDLIEGCGVPHTEVELIVVNGESVPFSHLLRDGDRVAVYPMFEAFDVSPELRVRREVLREPRFVLDVHLGRLAAYLRMIGFDVEYRKSAEDAELVRVAAEERRILLTRDRGLLKHGDVTHGYWVRETDSRRQLAEIVTRFDLAGSMRPFTRCMVCNAELGPEEIRRCSRCGRWYWQGSHYRRMQEWIKELH